MAVLLRSGGETGFGESGIRWRFHVVVSIRLGSSENWVALRMTWTQGSRIQRERNPGKASLMVWDSSFEEDESGLDF